MAAIQALQQWCKQQCEGYRDVAITNMTTSFRDGLAFCAILHRHRPDLIDFSTLRKENVYENNELAFRVAEEELGIPALLDAEDMVALKVPDRLSILTYVSQYYNYFHGRSPIGGMSGVKRPPSKLNEEPAGKKAVPEPVTPPPPKPSPAHVPPEAKTKSAVQGKENAPVPARRHALAESTNTRSSNCAICGTHVHLVQRLLVDGKLYHRNCFRCKQCSRTLQSGNYKGGTDPGSFVCNHHEEPTHLQNSLLVCTKDAMGENKLADTTSASGSYLKGLESKRTAEEPIKTNQVPKSSVDIKAPASKSSNFGTSKFSSITANPISHWPDPVRKNLDDHETPAASSSLISSHWTSSSAKTQEARAKFFQYNSGHSGSPEKTEGVKSQGAPLSSSQAAGGSSAPGSPAQGASARSSKKDRARNVLMHALPGSQLSTNKAGNFTTNSSASNIKPSPTPSGFRHVETKSISSGEITRPVSGPTAVEKTKRGSPGTPTVADSSLKDSNQKGTIWTAAQTRFKDQPIGQPVNAGQKLDMKTAKAEGGKAADERSEDPAEWRARLKPVPNKFSNQGNERMFQKSGDVHKVAINISLNPTWEEKKPASSVTSSAGQDAGTDDLAKAARAGTPSSHPPPKKKLSVVPRDVSVGWEKAKQRWEDRPATPKREVPERPPEKAVASIKPSSPRTFQKHPGSRTKSSPKHRPDYIPEDEIQKEVRQIERDLDKLELEGVDMEKQLRTCEGDDTEDALMVEWFKLIHEKQLLLRRESELMHKLNHQKLELKQYDIESELRSLMNKSEFLKSPRERAREEELLKLYVATVDDRNKIVENLDEDRLREQEEDEMLAAMIQKLDVPRHSQENDRKKAKFSLSKLLRMDKK
ncbi:hypothetical protein JRQ81_010325 [Phrynocephalus forsythii]|uniref:MICAL-like protein 2 n=1 Tax=Phrynocephalus forsythii TaxID=171643 RepID=A0A9Q0X8F7_9SAUR|nr:hypothetical protein JRQ81_010325 [Phrynocephalus forsythii]